MVSFNAFIPFFVVSLACLGRVNANEVENNDKEKAPLSIDSIQPGSGLEESADGRNLLRYVVRCALPAGTHITVPHEERVEILKGSLGLAPDWRDKALTVSGQRKVSACLLGLVNAFGVHVKVSMRGPYEALAKGSTSEEQEPFTYQEAAFYGNIFSTPPVSYVCRGAGGNKSSPWRDKRVCSDLSDNPPLTKCGMIFTGDCSDVCQMVDEKEHYVTKCRGGSDIYDDVVTTFLSEE